MTKTSQDPDDYIHWQVSVPDRFREDVWSLENDDYDKDRESGYSGNRTLNNTLLAESILRDRILPFANDNISLDANEFGATRGFASRHNVLTIPIHVPRPLGEHIADLAKESEYAEWNYDMRVRQNSHTEEFVLRNMIIATETGVDKNE